MKASGHTAFCVSTRVFTVTLRRCYCPMFRPGIYLRATDRHGKTDQKLRQHACACLLGVCLTEPIPAPTPANPGLA